MTFETLKEQYQLDESLSKTAKALAVAAMVGFSSVAPWAIDAAKNPPKATSEQLQKIDLVFEKHPLAYAIAKHESKLNPFAVGDRGLKNKAYGIMQIRKTAIADVNRVYKTNCDFYTH